MQKVLVPCDFSVSSLEGLRFAVEFAAATSAAIIVLSVVSPEQQKDEPLVSEGLRKKFANMLITISPPVQIFQQIRFGRLVPVVIETVKELGISQVVVGTRGSRGWEGAFMGSNVEKIVKTSPVPVFAVKRETHLNDIKDIVFPCDLMLSNQYGTSRLRKIQAEFGARLHLLRVDTSGLADHTILSEHIRDFAAFHGFSKYTVNIIADPDEKEGILQFAREIGADMIAMTTHGALDLNHLYISSISADVVNHAHLLTWTCIQHPVNEPA